MGMEALGLSARSILCVCVRWPWMLIYVYAPSNDRRPSCHALTSFQFFLPALLPRTTFLPNTSTDRRGRVQLVHGLPQGRDQLRMHALRVSIIACAFVSGSPASLPIALLPFLSSYVPNLDEEN